MRTLRVDFKPRAWLDPRPLAFVLLALIVIYAVKFARADRVASEAGLSVRDLDWSYWLSVWLFALPVVLGNLVVRKLRRDPHLEIGRESVSSSFSVSYTRSVARERVSSVVYHPGSHRIRFDVPDGLVLTVEGDKLEPPTPGDGPHDTARLCAQALDVPLKVS